MIYHIGLDESGHGSIAGPMTVGFVKVHKDFNPQFLWDLGVKDSKLTNPELRSDICNKLISLADTFALVIPVTDINNFKHNIAFDKHVKLFVQSQDETKIEMFIDGLRVVNTLECKTTYIVNGDQSNPLIAAASIVSKHAHDLEIDNLDYLYPEWDFRYHRGYPIPDHVARILEYKPIPNVHKLIPTFTAVTNYCKKNNIKIPKWASSREKLRELLCN